MGLTHIDYKNVEKLFNISNLIWDIYTELYDLEVNDLVNTSKFNEQIERLKMIGITEKNVYSELDSSDNIKEIIDYINKNQKESKTKLRIINKLQRLLDTKRGYYLFTSKKKDYEQFIQRSSYVSEQIELAIDNDINNISLYYIQKIVNSAIKQELLEYKYKTIFTIIESEDNIDKYLSSDKVYLSTGLVCELYGLSDDLQHFYKNSIVFDKCCNILCSLLEKKDYELASKDNLVEAIVLQSKLKAGLCLLDKKEFDKLYGCYKNGQFNNSMAKRLVDEAFNTNMEHLPIYTVKFKV